MPDPATLDLQSPRTRRVCALLILISIAAGAGLRLFEFFSRPSYWNDEAAIVVNVMRRDCARLTQPLQYAQAAPPLFLWAERGLYRAFGAGEWSLRSLPLALALASLVCFALLAWRWLPPTSAFWAVTLLAFSDKAIPHANQVKQYSGDVFVSISILLAAGKSLSPRGFWFASIVAAVGLWFSFPAVFIFGALSLVSTRLLSQNKLPFLAGNALVAVSFLLLYTTCLRHGHDPSLDAFWQASFPNLHRFPQWLGWQLYDLIDYPIESFGLLTAGFAILGFVALALQHRTRLLLLLPAALGLALVAAIFHRYPFPGRNRLSLYLLPILFLLLGAAAEPQHLGLRGWLLRWYWIFVSPLLIISIGQSGKHLFAPEESSTIRPLATYLKSHRKPDEPLMLVGDADGFGWPATGRNVELLCYWPQPPGEVIERLVPAETISAKRFWLVYSLKRPETASPDYASRLLQQLGNVDVIESHTERGQSGAILVQHRIATR